MSRPLQLERRRPGAREAGRHPALESDSRGGSSRGPKRPAPLLRILQFTLWIGVVVVCVNLAGGHVSSADSALITPAASVETAVSLVAWDTVFTPGIITLTLILGSLASAPIAGLSPLKLVVTAAGAWSLSLGCSPLNGSMVMFANIIGVRSETIAFRWNGWFAAGTIALFCVAIYFAPL